MIRHLWGATRVAVWLARENWHDRNERRATPRRRAEDGTTTGRMLVTLVLLAAVGFLLIAGLDWFQGAIKSHLDTRKAIATAQYERRQACIEYAAMRGEPADCGVAK